MSAAAMPAENAKKRCIRLGTSGDRATSSICLYRLLLLPVIEYFVNGQVEKPCDPKGEGKRGIVLAGLDRIDRLAGNFEMHGEFGLTPFSLGAKGAKAVFHDLPKR